MIELNTNCTACKSFLSFQDEYEDNVEPHDQGFCLNDKSPFSGNEGAGINTSCDLFENIEEARDINLDNDHKYTPVGLSLYLGGRNFNRKTEYFGRGGLQFKLFKSETNNIKTVLR